MELTVTDSSQNMAYWQQRPYLSEETKLLLTGIEVLIVPEEDFRDYEIPLFPSNMMELYDLLKVHLKAEAAINDEDYQELSLNSKVHRFGKFVVLSVVAPLFVGLLTNYISEKLKHEEPNDEINLEIVVENEKGKSKSIKFQGTTDNLKEVADKVKELASEDDEHRKNIAATRIPDSTKRGNRIH